MARSVSKFHAGSPQSSETIGGALGEAQNRVFGGYQHPFDIPERSAGGGENQTTILCYLLLFLCTKAVLEPTADHCGPGRTFPGLKPRNLLPSGLANAEDPTIEADLSEFPEK